METNAAITDAPAPATVNPLERRLDLSLSIAELDKEVEQRLKRMAKNMKMPGFRPGKIPASIIKQQYGEQARNDALGEAVGRLFSEAVTAQQMRVAGAPKIETKGTDGGTHLEFAAVFEVYPEIALAEVDGLEIERPVLDVGDEEIDRTIEILRTQRLRFEPVARAAANADRVSVDFVGKKDGELFPGGEGKDYRFVLGEGKMLADFEQAVLGTAAGEAKVFDLTFPADYFAKDLAGQTVTFELTVKEVGEPVLPELDADFARLMGIEDGDLVKMRAEIEANLRREVKKRLQAKITEQVMDKLLSANAIDVPTALVGREIERMIQQARQDLEQRGMNVKDMPVQPAWFADQAKRRVSLGLILTELVKRHELQARPQQVRAMAEEAAQSYEHPEEVLRWYYAQNDRLAEFEGAAVEANVVDWVLSRAKVEDKAVVFSELMGQNP